MCKRWGLFVCSATIQFDGKKAVARRAAIFLTGELPITLSGLYAPTLFTSERLETKQVF